MRCNMHFAVCVSESSNSVISAIAIAMSPGRPTFSLGHGQIPWQFDFRTF